MFTPLTRRRFITMASEIGMAAIGLGAWASEERKPLLRRIKMATVGASDLADVEDLYTKWLGYAVAERGLVSRQLAESWGTPNSAGRPFVSMRPQSGADVFVRAVQIDPMPDYKPMTTTGWNAIEIIVDDVYRLFESIKKSPYEILGEPRSLGGTIASVHAMQLIGPAREVVYLTCETGDRDRSTLPVPRSFVDRPFIMVLAGTDLGIMETFYSQKFGLPNGGKFSMPVRSIARAQGYPMDHIFELSLLRCAEKGNSIELDGYPPTAGPRPSPHGQLPPGVAITSFSVRTLDIEDVPFIAKPVQLYGVARAATFVGPAGELTELVEEPA